ncbi:MAG: hypothetical protein M1825_005264 [Sarcosagium campestre]|nr:MAG: hypothetical protein M1825_005264 [Sarcosagium campestre]
MPVSMKVLAPATAACLAYLNARGSVSYDWLLLSSVIKSTVKLRLREHRDRVNLFYVLEEHAQSKTLADTAFIWYQGRTWTYKQMYDRVLQYGVWLKHEIGVEARDIVAMNMMNSDIFIFIWLALWSIGAIPAFINYNLTDDALRKCLQTSTARLVLIEEEVARSMPPESLAALESCLVGGEAHSPMKVVVVDAQVEALVASMKPVRQPDSLRAGAVPSGMSMLIYTSGTTGLPKPAICMPLYHGSAVILGVCSALNGGSSIAIGRTFSTKTFWTDVRQSNSTIIQYVGETCRYLLAAPAQFDPDTGAELDRQHKVRLAFGNGLRSDIWEPFKQRFGIEEIAEFYAATEGTSAFWNLSRNTFSSGAIGRNGVLAKLALGSQLVVVRFDWETDMPWRDAHTGRCQRVDKGEAGELLYRLDARDIAESFQGYLGNEQATKDKVLRDVINQGDAWFRTGDMVRWDEQGRWYFNDRVGDTFRWKSENVSTTEVAESLGRHAAVSEANVYGVPVPGHDGRAGMATVVLKQEASQAVMTSLADHVLSTLPGYARPLFLRVTQRMPTTGTNKQQKHVLCQQGFDLEKVEGDGLFWLRDDVYVPFERRHWDVVNARAVKL